MDRWLANQFYKSWQMYHSSPCRIYDYENLPLSTHVVMSSRMVSRTVISALYPEVYKNPIVSVWQSSQTTLKNCSHDSYIPIALLFSNKTP